MRLHKLSALLTVATLSIGLAACGSDKKAATPSNNSTTSTPAGCKGPADAYVKTVGTASDFKPVVADTLTVVTSLPGPGFFEGSDSDPTKISGGYEYDIAKAMQTAFGLKKLVVENKPFDAIVSGQVKDYDIAFSQISITCERAKVVNFSQPYFQSNQGILVNKGTVVSDVAAAKKLHWGVQTSTTAIDLLKKIGAANVSVYKDLPSGFTALQAKQIDAFLVDTAINLGEAARSGGKFEVVAQFAQDGGPDQYGAILPKDSNNAGAVNAVFKALTNSGELTTLAKKDLTADPGGLPVIKG